MLTPEDVTQMAEQLPRHKTPSAVVAGKPQFRVEFPISGGGQLQLTITTQPNAADFDKIIKLVELLKEIHCPTEEANNAKSEAADS